MKGFNENILFKNLNYENLNKKLRYETFDQIAKSIMLHEQKKFTKILYHLIWQYKYILR